MSPTDDIAMVLVQHDIIGDVLVLSSHRSIFTLQHSHAITALLAAAVWPHSLFTAFVMLITRYNEITLPTIPHLKILAHSFSKQKIQANAIEANSLKVKKIRNFVLLYPFSNCDVRNSRKVGKKSENFFQLTIFSIVT